jgi:hypothetical protein
VTDLAISAWHYQLGSIGLALTGSQRRSLLGRGPALRFSVPPEAGCSPRTRSVGQGLSADRNRCYHLGKGPLYSLSSWNTLAACCVYLVPSASNALDNSLKAWTSFSLNRNFVVGFSTRFERPSSVYISISIG